MFIFLKKGEVWRYGVTRKGERIRYPAGAYGAEDLIYVPQFKGDYAACLKEEKRKRMFSRRKGGMRNGSIRAGYYLPRR